MANVSSRLYEAQEGVRAAARRRDSERGGIVPRPNM